MYLPKHVPAGLATLRWRAKSAIIAGLAVFAMAGSLFSGSIGTAAAASYPSPAPAGAVHLALDDLCLDNTANSGTAGTPVQIWQCLGDAAQQWQFWPDGTLRPASHPTLALGLDFQNLNPNGRPTAVLQNVTAPADSWTPSADRALIDNTSSGSTYFYLNDPGSSTVDGTKLIGYPQTGPTAPNEQWTPTSGASYATSELAYRPDSGGDGTWALDTITRISSIVYEGDSASGVHQYLAAVSDTGTFITAAGSYTPNQAGSDKGLTLGDVSTGTMSGVTAYNFTSDNLANSSGPPASVQGIEPTSTSDWYQLWFPAGTTFAGQGELTSGPLDWRWSYSLVDNCGKTENWTDADPSAGQGAGDGNITAPALSSC
jgi:hypothetical protein